MYIQYISQNNFALYRLSRRCLWHKRYHREMGPAYQTVFNLRKGRAHHMFSKKIAFQVSLIVSLIAATLGVFPQQALAHGSFQSPISRVYNCYLEGPEHPISAACQAAIALGGTQAMYDWNGVR